MSLTCVHCGQESTYADAFISSCSGHECPAKPRTPEGFPLPGSTDLQCDYEEDR